MPSVTFNKIRPAQSLPNNNLSFMWDDIFIRFGNNNNVQHIELYGSFNNWNTPYILHGDTLTLDLSPGIYQYKYKCGTNWYCDPAKPTTYDNGYINNVVDVRSVYDINYIKLNETHSLYFDTLPKGNIILKYTVPEDSVTTNSDHQTSVLTDCTNSIEFQEITNQLDKIDPCNKIIIYSGTDTNVKIEPNTTQSECHICCNIIIDRYVMYPCGHSGFCVNCSSMIHKDGKCPICRQDILDAIKIYN